MTAPRFAPRLVGDVLFLWSATGQRWMRFGPDDTIPAYILAEQGGFRADALRLRSLAIAPGA